MAMQYIGARYVPIVYKNPDDGSANWKANVAYEPLTILVDNGDSYTSRKAVPPSVGRPSENGEYWVKTGDFNASLLALQREMQEIDNDINNNETGLKVRVDVLENISYVMQPSGTTDDRSTELATALLTHKTVIFMEGDYYFNSSITLPEDSKIYGVGNASHLIYTGTDNFLIAGSGSEIANVKLDGGATTTPAVSNGAIGIHANNKTNTILVHDCEIFGFGDCGIKVSNMGHTYINSIIVNNVYFKNNYKGVEFAEYGEFGIISNCNFNSNSYGLSIGGGNNIIANCNVSDNFFGIQVDGNNIANSAHGSITGCTMNHNTYGLRIRNTTNGESVVGCLFYHNTSNDLEMSNASGGINIDGNNFGTESRVGIVGSIACIKNNVFADYPASWAYSTSTIYGYGNMTGSGEPILGMNSGANIADTQILTKTYAENTILTEAYFNSNLNVYLKGGILFINFNLPFSGGTSGSFVKIGSINLPLHYSALPFEVNADYEGRAGDHFIFKISTNGDISVWSTATNAQALANCLCIPMTYTLHA